MAVFLLELLAIAQSGIGVRSEATVCGPKIGPADQNSYHLHTNVHYAPRAWQILQEYYLKKECPKLHE